MDRNIIIHRTAALTAALMKGYVLSYEDMKGVHALKIDESGNVYVKELEDDDFRESSQVVDIKFLQKIANTQTEIQALEVRNYLITENFRWQ